MDKKSDFSGLTLPLPPGVLADQFALLQKVPLQRFFQVLLGRARRQVQADVERIQLEEVTMRFARRRTGASIANFVKIGITLASADGEFTNFRHAFWQICSRRRQVV